MFWTLGIFLCFRAPLCRPNICFNWELHQNCKISFSPAVVSLVGRELDRYKVEIAALSETRLAEVWLLKEVGAGYTFFWSERKKEERREAGVGFAIKSASSQDFP